MIEFLWPWGALFLPLPALVYLLYPRASRQEAALHVPFFGTASTYESDNRFNQRRSIMRRVLMLLMWMALVLAVTRPQWIGEPIELPASGRDLLLAVDISGSMGTEDMKSGNTSATRLVVVKNVVGEFVERRKGDRLGLILFGSQAYLQTPLTFDRNTVRTLLEETPLGIAGGKTAIGDAIGLAVKRLKERPAENRVLVLLTDGVNNVGEVSPLQAAKLAALEGIRIYTIGFGADELVVPGLLFNRKINPSADLDTKTLTEIANLTGGLYQRARSATELTEIYAALDELEPIELEQKTYRPVKSLFFWPLGFAMCLSLLFACMHPVMTSWVSNWWAGRKIKAAESHTGEKNGQVAIEEAAT
ncbi:MAG: BatB protein [Gammaproteobacteria bacterium]|nr:BatB protein [Gammaproteobacteria bacterium]